MGKGFTLPVFTDQVVRSDLFYEGQESYQFETDTARYIYHKQGAGFASLFDNDNHDWISYKDDVEKASGHYRGIPNMVHPEDMLHPGKTTATTTPVYEGPLKETIRTGTNDNKWEVLWEIYPTYARMTMLKLDHNYWFLYEGTPGGTLEAQAGGDFVVRSDGTQTDAGTTWSADLGGNEWVYFADPAVQ